MLEFHGSQQLNQGGREHFHGIYVCLPPSLCDYKFHMECVQYLDLHFIPNDLRWHHGVYRPPSDTNSNFESLIAKVASDGTFFYQVVNPPLETLLLVFFSCFLSVVTTKNHQTLNNIQKWTTKATQNIPRKLWIPARERREKALFLKSVQNKEKNNWKDTKCCLMKFVWVSMWRLVCFVWLMFSKNKTNIIINIVVVRVWSRLVVDTNSCCPNDVDSNLMETIKHSIFGGALVKQLLMVVDKNYAICKIT